MTDSSAAFGVGMTRSIKQGGGGGFMSEVIAEQVGCPPTNHDPFHAISENRVIGNHVNSHWEPRKRSPRPRAQFPAKRRRRPAHRSQSCHSEAERGGGICGTWHGRKGMPVSHSPSAISH